MRSGNRNTKWFHSKASQRRRKNNIGVFDSKGKWESEGDKIGKVAAEYFKRLFKSSNPRAAQIEKITSCVSTSLSDQQRRSLDQPYTKQEVEAALKSMNPSKAPGIDGTHASFYQSY